MPSRYFPPLESATDDGLLCVGGQLAPDWLLDAYSHGIFPWPIWNDRDPMAWWSPDPRAVIEFAELRVTRRLRRTLRSRAFEVTANRDFAGVIQGCATAQDRDGHTWITPAINRAYRRLHKLGHAHSVEVWSEGKLVGGIYGVAIGGLFAGESMFHYQRDASKVALVHLTAHLTARGYTLFDIQQLTDHTASMGAREISRDVYLGRLAKSIQQPVSFGEVLEDAAAFGKGEG